MSNEEFRIAVTGSPRTRAKLRGLKRNAAAVVGDTGSAEAVDVLLDELDDAEPLARANAAWALGRIGSPTAAPRLRGRWTSRRTGLCVMHSGRR
jgi:hypothetical protein